jgi:hypothetical protein
MKNKPIEKPLIEDLEIKINDNHSTQQLLIENKQAAKLDQISLFKSQKIKGIVKAKIKRNL